jgi:hypothetical protein
MTLSNKNHSVVKIFIVVYRPQHSIPIMKEPLSQTFTEGRHNLKTMSKYAENKLAV